jgi:putative component of membrane protein insertase Oxa1/YidC/SpoIIIJ protein YidD
MPFPRCGATQPASILGMMGLLILITLLFLPITGRAMEPAGQPPLPENFSMFSLGIGVYQKYLSPVLDSNCYMEPSCSVYAKQALTEYGPGLGLLLTVDRLLREANEERTSPLIRKGNNLKLYDPPQSNIWWK